MQQNNFDTAIERIRLFFNQAQQSGNVKSTEDMTSEWFPLQAYNIENSLKIKDLESKGLIFKPILSADEFANLNTKIVEFGYKSIDGNGFKAPAAGMSECLSYGEHVKDFLNGGKTLTNLEGMIKKGINEYLKEYSESHTEKCTFKKSKVQNIMTTTIADKCFENREKTLVLFLGNGSHPGGNPLNVSNTQEEPTFRHTLSFEEKIFLNLVLGFYNEIDKRFCYFEEYRPIDGKVIFLENIEKYRVVAIAAAPSFDIHPRTKKLGDGRIPGSKYLIKTLENDKPELTEQEKIPEEIRPFLNLKMYKKFADDVFGCIINEGLKRLCINFILGALGCGVFQGQSDIIAQSIVDTIASCYQEGSENIQVMLAILTMNLKDTKAVKTFNTFAEILGESTIVT